MKIAVCDDCMKDALYLKGFLGGHEVRVYSDACNLFADMEDKKERYDLYLLDIYMEGPIDGIELAKKSVFGRKRRLFVLFLPAMIFIGKRMTFMQSSIC